MWVYERGAQPSERTACGTNLPSWSWASTAGRKQFRFNWFAKQLSVPTTTLLQIVKFSCPSFAEQHNHNGKMEDRPREDFGITITIQAFTRGGEVTVLKHQYTRHMVYGIKFGQCLHDWLDIWWDEEPREGDLVLSVPLSRSDGHHYSRDTTGLILMRDKSSHIKNNERRYRRVGVFYEHSGINDFKILSEDFDVNGREEICLC